MAVVGYARVSSEDQSLDVQRDALAAAGCEKVFEEKRSGTTVDKREELARALDYVREGDTFVVTRIDRLARSVSDLHGIVDRLKRKGVAFKATQQGEFDTTTAHGALFLMILAGFAEFETALRAERQREGIEKAKVAGRYKGRPKKVDAHAAIRRLKAEGVRPAHIAKQLKVARSTVYEALKDKAADVA